MLRTFSEDVYQQTLINPVVLSTGANNSGWVAMTAAQSALFRLAIGNADGVVDMKLQEATDSSGTGAADITGAAITQLSATDDNKQASIEVNGPTLSDGFTHVRAVVTAAGSTTVGHLEVLVNKNHRPVTQPAAYAQQVILVD